MAETCEGCKLWSTAPYARAAREASLPGVRGCKILVYSPVCRRRQSGPRGGHPMEAGNMRGDRNLSETRGARIMCCGPESCTPHTFPASIGCPQRSARIRGCGPESCTSHTFPASIGCPQRGSPWRRRHTGIAAPMRFFVMNCSRICSHPARLRKGLQVAVGACHKGFKWLLAREFQCRSGENKNGGPAVGTYRSDRGSGARPRAAPRNCLGPFSNQRI